MTSSDKNENLEDLFPERALLAAAVIRKHDGAFYFVGSGLYIKVC